jgi:hypothetical protein
MTISFVVGGGSKTTADFSASLRNDKQKDRRNDKQGDGRNDKQRDRQKMTNKMSGNRECKATADFSARLLTRCVSSFGRNDVSLLVGGGSNTTADFSASLRNDKQRDGRNDKQGDGRNDKQEDKRNDKQRIGEMTAVKGLSAKRTGSLGRLPVIEGGGFR